jgi:hypothetical protein
MQLEKHSVIFNMQKIYCRRVLDHTHVRKVIQSFFKKMNGRCLTKPVADQDVQDNTIPPTLIKVWQHMPERKLQKIITSTLHFQRQQ